MTDRITVRGKNILITGASSGFGEHFAKALAADGAHVILAARRVEKCQATVDTINQAGGQASAIALDVGDEQAVAEAISGLGALDVVINNAGINRIGQTHEIDSADWDAIFQTNLKGVWHCSKAAINRWMADNQPGNIINVASVLGLRVSQVLGPYCASKAAVIHLTKSIALDYARYQIRCNALCPGFYETDINREFLAGPGGEKLIKRIPFRRAGDLDELLGPVMLLASDASSYMSGAVIPVDGGHLCSTM